MRVEKRDGSIEEVSFDKITKRIVSLCNDVNLKSLTKIDPQLVAQKVSSEIYDGVTTTELDLLSSEIAISLNEAKDAEIPPAVGSVKQTMYGKLLFFNSLIANVVLAI